LKSSVYEGMLHKSIHFLLPFSCVIITPIGNKHYVESLFKHVKL